MNIRNFLVACFTLFFGVFALAQNAMTEEKELSEVCIDYQSLVQNKDILNAYPFFKGEGIESKNAKPFSYRNLNPNQTNAYVRLYAFEKGGLSQAYKNLLEILQNNPNKPLLRKTLPQQDAEDTLRFVKSLEKENDGKTCYIIKSENEIWIHSQPMKPKEFIFILRQEEQSTKLYYYENITFDEG